MNANNDERRDILILIHLLQRPLGSLWLAFGRAIRLFVSWECWGWFANEQSKSSKSTTKSKAPKKKKAPRKEVTF